MTSALEHLDKARLELIADRDRLDRDIAVLDEVIGRLRVGRSDDPGVPMTIVSGTVAPDSIRDIALWVAKSGTAFSLTDVVNAAKARGNTAQYESISSVVSRLSKEGRLDKVGRGTYRLATKPEGSTESVEPSEVTNRTSAATDAPDQEGADDDRSDRRRGDPSVAED